MTPTRSDRTTTPPGVDRARAHGDWSFHAIPNPDLPALGWVADARVGTGEVVVAHGERIETGPGWAVEGVWEGPFQEGNFHRAEHFFGSGVRADGDTLYVVPSRALVDRVVYATLDDRVLASNSLVALLAWTGASLDPATNYHRQSYAILAGIDRYDPSFPVAHSRLDEFRQLYYERLLITRAGIARETLTRPRGFADFSAYKAALEDALERIARNARAAARRGRAELLATASTGYDSPAAAALVRSIGVHTAYVKRRSNSAVPAIVSPRAGLDDGSPIARHLGMEPIYLEDAVPSAEDELLFLAPSSAEAETAFEPLARRIRESERLGVLFTGYHGDGIWDVNTDPDDAPESVKRKDTSGLNLGEIRLAAGFVHVPVPFLYVRSQRSIASISRSKELEPWRVHTAYDRPIPRRILEDAGVPRSAFGFRKKAVIRLYALPRNPSLKRAFLDHLRQRRGISRAFVVWHVAANHLLYLARAVLAAGRLRRFGRPAPLPRVTIHRQLDLPYELFTWSLSTAAARLRARLGRPRVAPWTGERPARPPHGGPPAPGADAEAGGGLGRPW